MFFRFVMPFIVFVLALIYFFVDQPISHGRLRQSSAWRSALASSATICPTFIVSNIISKRQQSIMRAFPDALDLMLICVESGMSIEADVHARGVGDRPVLRPNSPRNWG